MKLIVGLGNPGARYERTRHNIGFWVIERLAQKRKVEGFLSKFKAEYAEARLGPHKLGLLKPQTYMNRSGEAVDKARGVLGITEKDLCVIHDDMDLALGRIKLKRAGGDGGHKGVRSIADHLGTPNFLRVRVGVGRPAQWFDPAEYVLQEFEPEHSKLLDETVTLAVEGIMLWIRRGLQTAVNHCHSKRLDSLSNDVERGESPAETNSE